jgi:hypothetical protein
MTWTRIKNRKEWLRFFGAMTLNWCQKQGHKEPREYPCLIRQLEGPHGDYDEVLYSADLDNLKHMLNGTDLESLVSGIKSKAPPKHMFTTKQERRHKKLTYYHNEYCATHGGESDAIGYTF